MRIIKYFMVMMRRQLWLMPITDLILSYAVRKFHGTDIRVMRLVYCLEQTRYLKADIAECGIGSGYSMIYILSYLQRARDKRHYFGFDTFEGFPFIHSEDLIGLPKHRKEISVVGRYKEFVLNHHLNTIKKINADNYASLFKGLFSKTIPPLPNAQMFSFVFMDCDLYESYRTCLDAMYPRIVPGGIILFDEYEHVVEWPGAKKAIDEFFCDKQEKPEKLPFGTSWIVKKQ